MAYRTCPHCRKRRVDHRATVCPYCTRELVPVSFWKTKAGGFLIFIVILVGFTMLGSLLPGEKTSNPISSSANQQPRCPNMPTHEAQLQTLQELKGSVFLSANLKDNKHWYITADKKIWDMSMKQDRDLLKKSLFCLSLIEGKSCCRRITIQDISGFPLYDYDADKEL